MSWSLGHGQVGTQAVCDLEVKSHRTWEYSVPLGEKLEVFPEPEDQVAAVPLSPELPAFCLMSLKNHSLPNQFRALDCTWQTPYYCQEIQNI